MEQSVRQVPKAQLRRNGKHARCGMVQVEDAMMFFFGADEFSKMFVFDVLELI